MSALPHTHHHADGHHGRHDHDDHDRAVPAGVGTTVTGPQPVAARRRVRRQPGFSLLRASLAERLAIAAMATAGIWGGVYWAIA